MKTTTLNLVKNSGPQTPATIMPDAMSDADLDQKVIELLNEVRTLRHEITNKRNAYELSMQINNRLRLKVERLESERAILELALKTFNPQKAA